MTLEHKYQVAMSDVDCDERRKSRVTRVRSRESGLFPRSHIRRFQHPLKRLSNAIVCVALALGGTLHAQQGANGNGTVSNPAAALFDSTCAVCHGSDGRGGERAPNIATEREMVKLSDTQLTTILNKGVLASGMPAFGFLGDEKIKHLVAYLRQLQGLGGSDQLMLPGDPAEGEKIFFERDSCSSCHMVHGRGGFLSEDLSAYAHGRSVPVIHAAIFHPASILGSAGHLVDIHTADGTLYRGLVRARDNFNVVLQGEDGAYHSIARERIQQMTASSQPLMPEDYAAKFDEKRLNDLISYLLQSAASEKTDPPTNEEEN